MKLVELLTDLIENGGLEDVEVQRVEFDPEQSIVVEGEKPEPTYTVYFESMTNGEVLGATIEVSAELFAKLQPELKYPEPIASNTKQREQDEELH
jgi:hypothetical protein